MPDFGLNTIIIIAFILFPGIVFRRFYFCGNFSKQFYKGNWSERLIQSIFWGTLIQSTGVFLLLNKHIKYYDLNVYGERVYNLLFNNDVKGYYEINTDTLLIAIVYGFFIIIFSAIFGFSLHKIVRLFQLDIHSKALRFSNYWHYYLTGEILKSSDFKKIPSNRKIAGTSLDIVLPDGAGKTKLIQGDLIQYNIDTITGDLEYIYLINTKKYNNHSKEFQSVPSHLFTIPCKDVIDMNIRYQYGSIKGYTFKITDFIKPFILLVIPILIGYLWNISSTISIMERIIGSIFLATSVIMTITTLSIISSKKSTRITIFLALLFTIINVAVTLKFFGFY